MTSVPVISAVNVVLGEKAWATKADEMPTMTGRGITHFGSTATTSPPSALGGSSSDFTGSLLSPSGSIKAPPMGDVSSSGWLEGTPAYRGVNSKGKKRCSDSSLNNAPKMIGYGLHYQVLLLLLQM